MRKLTLSLDTLKVDSFETNVQDGARGTVRAHWTQHADESCFGTCDGMCTRDASCQGGCGTGYASCWGTCGASCGGTCVASCGATCTCPVSDYTYCGCETWETCPNATVCA